MAEQQRPKGSSHPRWKGGKTVTSKGYVRITAGLHRFKYEHRVVADAAWRETYGTGLPAGKEVHHIDGNRQHNCRCNLLICDEAIHSAFQTSNPRGALGMYVPKQQQEVEDAPGWVTNSEFYEEEGQPWEQERVARELSSSDW